MKKRIVSLLLAVAMLVLLAVPAFAEDGHAYTYVALGDSITAGIGLPDAVYQKNGSFYDVSGNYHGYSGDCYVAKVADALGLDRDHAINYGMPALMSNNLLELVQTGATHSDNADYTLPGLREELQTADLINDSFLHRLFSDQHRPEILCEHGSIEHQLLQPFLADPAMRGHKSRDPVLNLLKIVIRLRRTDCQPVQPHRMHDHRPARHDKRVVCGHGKRHADRMAAAKHE